MGRRRKEPASAHRERISSAAKKLFANKGIRDTSMDDIAKLAGYSKATLYVYFKNKEEIIGVLVRESMEKLDGYITAALQESVGTRERYDAVCQALLHYQEEFPYYFRLVLAGINTDFKHSKCEQEEKETYRIGEDINEKIGAFIQEGIARGELRADIAIAPTIFTFWGMLSGLIQMADSKEAYILKGMKLSRLEFLSYGFGLLYRSIENFNRYESESC